MSTPAPAADIFLLPPHDAMTVEECLSHCHLDRNDFREVLVIGTDGAGRLKLRSSEMTRKDALWLVTMVADRILGRAA